MRQVVLLIILPSLACGTRAPSSPTPREVPAVPGEAKTAPTASLFDDAVFVSNKGVREHLVIHRSQDGWTYALEATLVGGTARLRMRIEADRGGALRTAAIEAEDGSSSARTDLTREGDEIAIREGLSTARVPAGNLYLAATGSVGQLASLCATQGARTESVILASPLTIGPAEMVVEGVSRARLSWSRVEADLYCDGEKVLALDGPEDELIVREGGEASFAAARRPPLSPPALPEGVEETERSVVVKATEETSEVTLTCSYVAPSNPTGRVAAVALQNGNNGHARDGDDPGDDPYARRWVLRLVAYGLGEAGIASLRCDARPAQSRGFLTFEEFEAHATAMLNSLASESAVDRKRLGLFAIHEAATVAPRVWNAVPVRALVMLGAHARTGAAMFLASAEGQARAAGLDEVQIKQALDVQREIYEAIRSGRPLPTNLPADYVAVIEVTRDYLRSFLDYDASLAAKKVRKTAVLLADARFGVGSHPGDDDFDDVGTFASAFAVASGKKQNAVETKVYPHVDNYFRERTAGEEGRQPNWWTPVSRDLVSDVVEFLSRRLSG